MEKENKELDEVLDLFISSDKKASKVPWVKSNTDNETQKEQDAAPALAETTRIQKEIECPPGPKAQDKIRGLLFEYLQADYQIARVDLKKVSEKREADKEIHTEEEVSLLLKEP